MKIRPLQETAIVKPLEEEEKHQDGIIIHTAKEKPQEGKVIAVEREKVTDEGKMISDVKAGDRISFGKYAGTEVKIEGERTSHYERRGILESLKGNNNH